MLTILKVMNYLVFCAYFPDVPALAMATSLGNFPFSPSFMPAIANFCASTELIWPQASKDKMTNEELKALFTK